MKFSRGELVRHSMYKDLIYMVMGPEYPPDKKRKYTVYQTMMYRLLALGGEKCPQYDRIHEIYLEAVR
jgi:hypothetical protein